MFAVNTKNTYDSAHPVNLDKLPNWIEVVTKKSDNGLYSYIAQIKVSKSLTFETANLLRDMAKNHAITLQNSQPNKSSEVLMCKTLYFIYNEAEKYLLELLQEASLEISKGNVRLYGFPNGTLVENPSGKNQSYAVEQRMEKAAPLAAGAEEYLAQHGSDTSQWKSSFRRKPRSI